MLGEKEHHAIDYIELSVESIADAKKFYGAVFGWHFTDYGPDYCGFRAAETSPEIGGFAKATKVDRGGPLLVFWSEDLEASRSTVEKSKGKIAKEIFSFPGGRRFEFLDPSGNLLAVWGT